MEWIIPLGMLMITLGKSSCVALENDSPQILSFAFEERDTLQNQWRSTTDIERGKNIRLICTIDSPFSDQLNITKQGETNELGTFAYPNNRQISLEFSSLECDQFGIYVCDDGLGASQNIELGIFDCEPRLCDESKTTKKTIPVSLHEPLTLSVCVSAYPEIDAEYIAPAFILKRSPDTEIGARLSRNIPPPTGMMDAQNTWQIAVDHDPSVFGVYTVNIIKPSITLDDYGEHGFAIFTIHGGERKQLTYKLVLEPVAADPPGCPTDLEVASPEVHSFTLSWQAGSSAGPVQVFQVYFSTDKEDWVAFGGATRETTLHVTGLQADTLYFFRVISAYESLLRPSVNQCQNTVECKTAKLAQADDEMSDLVVITAGLVSTFVFLVLAAIVTGAVCFIKRRERKPLTILLSSGRNHSGGVEEGLLKNNKTNGNDE